MKNIFLFFLINLIIISCSQQEKEDTPDKTSKQPEYSKLEQQALDDKNIIARVNGAPIYEKDLKGSNIQDAINNKLLYQEVLRRGLTKDDNGQVPNKKREILKLLNKSIEKDIVVSDEEIENYYRENIGDYESYLVIELVFLNKSDADKARKKIKSGKDFDKLIKHYSSGNSHSTDHTHSHSDVHTHVKVDPPYRDTLIAKDTGWISDVFERQGEFKIAKLREINTIPLNSLKRAVESKIRFNKRNEIKEELLDNLRAQSNIEKFEIAKIGVITKEKFIELSNSCLKMPHSFAKTNCLKPYFQISTTNSSAKNAIDIAHALLGEGLIDDCHMMSHFIGKATLEKNNYEVESAFLSCSRKCMQGCYHGVLENFVQYSKWDINEVPIKAKKLCEKISTDNILRRQCIHGVGHGLIAHNFVPLKESINTCNQFTNPVYKNSCLGGVFMEYMNKLLIYDEEEVKIEITKLCEEVEELNDSDLLWRCTKAIGEGLMFYTGHDLDKSKMLCKNLNTDQQISCLNAVDAMHEMGEEMVH